jgi:acetoin utilization deacetylase AcuC-like enzyme
MPGQCPRMPVVWTDRHRGHRPGGGYWLGVRQEADEQPDRGDALRDGLAAAGHDVVDAPDLGLDPILAVHDTDYVEFMSRAYASWVAEGHLVDPGQPDVVPYLFATAPFARRHVAGRRPATIRAELGLYAMDTMTLLSEGTFAAACAAVHAAVHAADLVAAGSRAAYAAVRPPGHHAGPAFFGGACYFNNAAAAAQRLLTSGCRRVAVVDIDAHQGNGTQEIFWDRADVLYGSVHVDPAAGWFPHLVGYADERGAGAGEGWTVNWPLPPGAGDEPWLAALRLLVDAVDEHESEAMVISLGVDSAAADSAAPLEVSAAGFRAAGSMLAGPAVPTVFVQEGGYVVEQLAALVDEVLAGFEEASGG